jgi:hypothetical protein
MPDRASDWTDSADICNDCYQLVLKLPGHASEHDKEKGMIWDCCIAHIGLDAQEMFQKVVTDTLKMPMKYDCENCVKWIFAQKPSGQNPSFRATKPLRLPNSDICISLDAITRGSRYMLLFMISSTRHTGCNILKY